MQTVDANYTRLFDSGNFSVGLRVKVNNVVYDEESVYSIRPVNQVFAENHPCVGSCVSGQLDVELLALSANIPRMARVEPQFRLYDGSTTSGWISKGTYFIDSRTENAMSGKITLHCYDSMMKTEAFFTDAEISGWGTSKTDKTVVNQIASKIGVTVEAETLSALNKNYPVPPPDQFDGVANMRKVLGAIGAAYAGNWTITADNKLRLIRLNALPSEEFWLVTPAGDYITFGGEKIDVS